MFRLQKNSQIVTLTPDITVDFYENLLQPEGFTGGYYPVKGKDLTLGDCLAARASNYFFLKYGGIEDLCVGGNIITKQKLSFQIKTAPRSATGPDLRRAIIGSENKLGQFQDVTLKVFPIPQQVQWGIVLISSWDVAFKILRAMVASFIQPIYAACLDEEETENIMKDMTLDSEGKMGLFFKLGGLKRMVEAEKLTLMELQEKDPLIYYWPSRKEDVEYLGQQLITEAHYTKLMEKFSPLIGRDPSSTESKAEINFKKCCEEVPC